jgi:hypothetical protein
MLQNGAQNYNILDCISQVSASISRTGVKAERVEGLILEQATQRTHNVTLERILETIVDAEKQEVLHMLSVCF